MNAIILSIGDELVLGQTIDTNSAWLSEQLAAVGCDISAHITVPDDQKRIEHAIRDSAPRCDFLIISGGIGPTEDDLTRQALAAVMGADLEMNEKWLHRLRAFFRARGREMPETNKIQAMIPQGAKAIENTAGTAAGIDAVLVVPTDWDLFLGEFQNFMRENPAEFSSESSTASPTTNQGPGMKASDEYMQRMFGPVYLLMRQVPPGSIWRQYATMSPAVREKFVQLSKHVARVRIFVMPGVPKEMKAMFTQDVLPHIAKSTGGAVILSRTLHTFGLGESFVAEKLGDLMKRDRNPSVGTTVSQGIVSLRINARFNSREEAEQKLKKTARACVNHLGDIVFGEDDQTLPEVVASFLTGKPRIIVHDDAEGWESLGLEKRSYTVTTAESCTGGLLAKMLTDIPGSSDFFKTGFVTYSNESKHALLGVPMDLINEHGAVSEPVVLAMAQAAKERAHADFALAISGIAGPSGGTPTKPVGTVCIALANPEGVISRTFTFSGDREMIRDRSAKMALTMLRFHLLGKPLPF